MVVVREHRLKHFKCQSVDVVLQLLTGDLPLVVKSGASSGNTVGRIRGVMSFQIDGESFEDQVIVESAAAAPFAVAGDSGAVYYLCTQEEDYPYEPLAVHRSSGLLDNRLVSFGSLLCVGLRELLGDELFSKFIWCNPTSCKFCHTNRSQPNEAQMTPKK